MDKADAVLSRQIYKEEQNQYEEQIKQVENKSSHEYHLNQMRDQIFPSQYNFVIRNRNNPSAYFEIPYKSEIQTPRLGESSSKRQIKREK